MEETVTGFPKATFVELEAGEVVVVPEVGEVVVVPEEGEAV